MLNNLSRVRMKKDCLCYIGVFVFFLLLAFIIFRCALGEGNMFSTSDGNIGVLARQASQLPERFMGSYVATPLLGGGSSIPISPVRIGLWLMSPEMYSDSWFGIYLTLSSLFFVAFLRQWSIRWWCCVFGALAAFWVGAVTLASAGHLGKFGVMMYFVASLYFIEKFIRVERGRQRILFGLLTGGSVALMLLTQQDVGLLAGLFLGPYAFLRLGQHYLRQPVVWLQLLVPIVLLGGGLSYSTASKAYKTNVTDAGLADQPAARWEFITQWSMVPEEIPDLFAPGYTGWSTGSAKGPYWGKVGRSADWEKTGKGFRNFRLDNLYIGIIPLLFAILGGWFAFRKLKEDRDVGVVFLFWTCMAATSLFLSFGKYSVLYKIFYHLPLVGDIRAPIKFMHNFQVITGLLCAFGVNEFLNGYKGKMLSLRKGAYAVASLAGLFLIFSFFPASDKFAEWGVNQKLIVENIHRAWVHVAVMSGVLAVFLFLLGQGSRGVIRVFLSLLIISCVFDSIYLTSHYFSCVDVTGYQKGNVVLNYLKVNQGNERIHFLSNRGPYNTWIGVDGPYHGLNLFNFWQMPRMSQAYKSFLRAAGANVSRLWQLTSCRYVAAPVGYMKQLQSVGIKPIMFFRFVMDEKRLSAVRLQKPESTNDQVLFEFPNYIPRFSFYRHWKVLPVEQQCETLFSAEFDPAKTVLLESDAVVPDAGSPARFEALLGDVDLKNAEVTIDSDTGGMVMFTQYWQPGWSVEVDGHAAKLIRCNYLCLGVYVPVGKHEVIFYYGR